MIKLSIWYNIAGVPSKLGGGGSGTEYGPLGGSESGVGGQHGKESYGPAGRDYFWILCRLVDSLPTTASSSVNLELLARQLSRGIIDRKIYEKRRFR